MKDYKYSFELREIKICANCPCCHISDDLVKAGCAVSMKTMTTHYDIVPEWCLLKREEVEDE